VWSSAHIYLFDPIMPEATTSKYAMLINWVGPTGTLPIYALSAVITADGELLAQWFEDKVVFVGSGVEREQTPMRQAPRRAKPPYIDQSNERTMTGLEVHANADDTIMRQRFIRPIPTPVVWAIIFACSLLTILAFRRLATWSAVTVAGLEMAVLFLLGMLLVRWDYWLYTVVGTTAIAFSGTVTGLWGYTRVRHEAAVLAGEVEAMRPLWVSDEGEEIEATVFVCDMAGYTARSEEATPVEMMQLIREFFAVVDEVVQPFGAMLPCRCSRRHGIFPQIRSDSGPRL